MYRAVTFHEFGSGAERRAVVGQLLDGLRVLAISGDDGAVTIIREGGTTVSVPGGALVRCEEVDAPVLPPRRATPVRKRTVERRPKGPPGTCIGVTFHERLGPRTVYVGDSVAFGSEVVSVGLGGNIWLANGNAVELPGGSVLRWHIQE